MAIQILRSSSQSGWPLRNIYISNDNGSFTYYVDVSFLYHCHDFYRTWLYTWVTRRVSYKKPELLTLREHLTSPPVIGGFRVAHRFSFFLCCPVTSLYVLSSVWFVFVQWCPQILCCVFVFVFFVLCALVCYQFLWIVLFWLPLWYYLTFIPLWNLHYFQWISTCTYVTDTLKTLVRDSCWKKLM